MKSFFFLELGGNALGVFANFEFQIVCKTIEVMLRGRQSANSNVLCAGYDKV